MKRLILLAILTAVSGGLAWSLEAFEGTVWHRRVVPIFMIVQGVGIVGIWTMDIARGALADGLFRSKENGVLFWPHLVAEFLTAGALGAGAVALMVDAGWSRPVSLLALGALGYTAINSLGWSLAERERIPYAIPMLFGLFGSAVSVTILL